MRLLANTRAPRNRPRIKVQNKSSPLANEEPRLEETEIQASPVKHSSPDTVGRPNEVTASTGSISADNEHDQSDALTAFQPVSLYDVAKRLQCVDPHKATGSDGIPGIVLKRCSDTLSPYLMKIVNLSLASGIVPSTFKHSLISPLYKNGDPLSARNCRPVSLLPIVSRILEHFVKKQLTTFLDDHSLLPSSQFAYRRNHSTEDALILASNRWKLAKSERKHTGVVMVDLSKAFDRVQHARLVQVLFDLGICDTPLEWFLSYLSERQQCVRVEHSVSQYVGCSRGVPQGSVLGPLLFVLYTSDMSSVLPGSVCHQEFADDVALDYSDYQPDLVCSVLSNAVTRLAEYLDNIGLLLNASKTQVMFVRPRGCLDGPSEVKCGTTVLDVTPVTKYLGVMLDDQLSWKPQVDFIASKTATTIGQLWRHGRCLSLNARRAWYMSMIQSVLCYASNCFFPALSKLLLHRLLRIAKSGIRAIFQLPRRTPTAPLFARLSMPQLHQLYVQRLLLFVFRCLHGRASSLFQSYYSLIATDVDRSCVTRGQVSQLLRVPLLPGPSGRSSIAFVGSTTWNSLPADIRACDVRHTFQALLSGYDLISLVN